MCGIIGYIGPRKASPVLLEGLKKLEYRGYDSAGMALVTPDGLVVKKGAGKIADLEKKLDFTNIPGNVGIAHNRWATHGKVSDENAHPHMDCDGTIAIVHNGIIENYKELKKELNMHRFTSETDSEVIAHLIEEGVKMGKDFETAFKDAISKLEGSYAILAIMKGENKIMAARKGSPLVVGVGQGETFISSDIVAFLEWTKKVIYLRDYDIVTATPEKIGIYNLKEGEVERPIDTLDWDADQIKKGGFVHYMIKEILEQAETIERAAMQDPDVINQIVAEIQHARGIFFIGCGSSYHAALTGSYLFSRVAGVHVNVVKASEFEHYEHFLNEKTLVFAISQSGETADVLEAVRVARRHGSKVISIVNRQGSTLTRESDVFVMMNAGPEICVLSTKTFTSQIAVLYLLASALAGRYNEAVDNLKFLAAKVYDLTARSTREHIQKLANILHNKDHIYLIGRGLQYATAMEAALKIREVSYIHAEAFAGGELKHGHLALIEEGTPVIAFVSNENKTKILSNVHEVKARGAFVVGISPENDELFDFWIRVPEVGDMNPIAQIIPIQILAYQLALLRGLDPDHPRNLAKSVTVT